MTDVTGLERTRVHQSREELEQQLDPEAVEIMLGICPADDEPLHRDTGVRWRPFPDTFRDLVGWLVASGRLDPKWAPALA